MTPLQKSIRTIHKIHAPTGQRVVSTVRKLRDFDKVYNSFVNPISFCEISWDDLGDNLPCDKALSFLTKSTPCRNICELYDTFTCDKDIVECLVSLLLQFNRIEKMDIKQKSMLVMKAYCLAYKLYWIAMACCGIPKSHEAMVCILDFLNFVLGSIGE
jgi:hypothetical protein